MVIRLVTLVISIGLTIFFFFVAPGEGLENPDTNWIGSLIFLAAALVIIAGIESDA